MKKIWILLLLTGCSSPEIIHLPNGAQGYSVDCGGTVFSMTTCYKKAGDVCGKRGYDILEQKEQPKVIMGAEGIDRYIIFQCKRFDY